MRRSAYSVVMVLIFGAALVVYINNRAYMFIVVNDSEQKDAIKDIGEFTQKVVIGEHEIAVAIADTDTSRMRGLSGHKMLAASTGMLFVFDKPQISGMWMKGMLFPLDIIWLNSEGVVVTVAEQIAPETFPEVFYSNQPASYVLEITAGEAQRLGISEGVKVFIK